MSASKIFLFLRSAEDCSLQVYCVDVDDSYGSDLRMAYTYPKYSMKVKKVSTHSELIPTEPSVCRSYVYWGRYIYAFGGANGIPFDKRTGKESDVKDVYRLDITSSSNEWELWGSMRIGRVRPGIAVHMGKAYIFGGTLFEPYGEVYDMELGTSEEIEKVGGRRLSSRVMVLHDDCDPCLLVGSPSSQCLMSYHIPTKYWQFFSIYKPSFITDGDPIVVELQGIKIFSYFKYKLHALALYDDDYFEAVLEDEYKVKDGFEDRHNAIPTLLHLGENNFCLVYRDGKRYTSDEKADCAVVHVTRFSVMFETKCNQMLKMRAKVSGNMNYLFDGNTRYEGAVISSLM